MYNSLSCYFITRVRVEIKTCLLALLILTGVSDYSEVVQNDRQSITATLQVVCYHENPALKQHIILRPLSNGTDYH